jgi:hypothetical protein
MHYFNHSSTRAGACARALFAQISDDLLAQLKRVQDALAGGTQDAAPQASELDPVEEQHLPYTTTESSPAAPPKRTTRPDKRPLSPTEHAPQGGLSTKRPLHIDEVKPSTPPDTPQSTKHKKKRKETPVVHAVAGRPSPIESPVDSTSKQGTQERKARTVVPKAQASEIPPPTPSRSTGTAPRKEKKKNVLKGPEEGTGAQMLSTPTIATSLSHKNRKKSSGSTAEKEIQMPAQPQPPETDVLPILNTPKRGSQHEVKKRKQNRQT